MSASLVLVCIAPQPVGTRQVGLDDVYNGSDVVTEVLLKFPNEAPYLSTGPRLTAQTQWWSLHSLDLTVQFLESRLPSPFHLTTYNFPVLTTLRLVNIPLHRDSELSRLRSLTLKNAARRPELRTSFRGFMQPLCTSYRHLKELSLDHALTHAPDPMRILRERNALPLTTLFVHDEPGRISGVLDYLQLEACTKLHLAITIPGVRPKTNTPNPFLGLLSTNWVCLSSPVQLREMNTVFVEVTTGHRVRMCVAHDPMGPHVPAMQSTGALKATFDVNFERGPSATLEDVVRLQGRTLNGVAETIPLLKMHAVSRISGITEQRTELRGELDRRPGGRPRWSSRLPGQGEWTAMAL